jgi:hypothetical protein
MITGQNIEMIFFGYKPEVVEAPNVSFVEHTQVGDMLAYFKKLLELQPDIVIVPLQFSDFNKCKSNNAMQEAFWAGALCVAPDMPEWANADYVYKNPEIFLPAVRKCIENVSSLTVQPDTRHQCLKLSKTNEWRHELACRLFAGDHKPKSV